MRSTLKIFALILLYFLACGKSCDNSEQNDAQREQRRITAETDSLRSVFGTDTLSASSLQAYMETAKQRFYDFNDYLYIVNDSSAAELFRNKAQEMIRSLFIVSMEPIKTFTPMTLDSVYRKEAFQRINDSVYKGRLVFKFTKHYQGDKIPKTFHETGIIEVFLVKGDKNFGKRRLRTWDVFLGKTE